MKKTFWQKIKSFFRKWMSAKIIPHMVLNGWRIFFYRLCGYNIGKNVFIGMRCYLDDLEPHMFTVEDDCIISYGVFFACHGRNQDHTPITIKRGAYIGMRANVISGKKWCDYRRKCGYWCLYACKQGCSSKSNCCRCAL